MAKRNPEEGTPTPAEQQSSAPAYLTAAARIPSTRPTGAPFTDTQVIRFEGDFDPKLPDGLKITDAASGVMVVDFIPTYGVSRSKSSALNRAMYDMFNKVRCKISGNRPYEGPDLMIYNTAAASLHAMYHYARRILGIINTYSAVNLYKPRTVLTAMGLNADDWIENASRLYQWLLAHRSSLLPFPMVPIGKIYDRQNTYNDYVFTDGEGQEKQIFILNQKYFWSYEEVDAVKGLTLRAFPDRFTGFMNTWDSLYEALTLSTDATIIAADIRRAFEDQVVTNLPDTPADYAIEYMKQDSILNTMRNASMLSIDPLLMSEVDVAKKFRIEDATGGYLKCDPTIEVPIPEAAYADVVYTFPAQLNHINMDEQAPDVNAFLSAIRLKPDLNVSVIIEDATNYKFKCEVLSMGTEVALGARIAYFNGTSLEPEIIKIGSAMMPDQMANKAGFFKTIIKIQEFDWHPPIVLLQSDDGTHLLHQRVAIAGTLEDVSNYIPLYALNLEDIHNANLLAEFGFKD